MPIVPGTKTPRVPWGEYQARFPTPAEIRQWWTEHPEDGIAVATGRVSNVCCIDVDPRNAGDESAALLLRRVGPALLERPPC